MFSFLHMGKLFRGRSQSDAARMRAQRQIYLAKENPEPVFDLSECEITQIPTEVYGLCEVLQKQKLLLNHNYISTLVPNDCSLKQLRYVTVLDLEHNELTSLPSDINALKSLTALNLGHNKLKVLPDTVGCLSNLRSLQLHNNRLKEVVTSVGNLADLRVLDISENRIKKLPLELHKLTSLRQLKVTASHMVYPNSEICEQGTIAILQFLGQDAGIEFLPRGTSGDDEVDCLFAPGHSNSPMSSSTSFHLIQEDRKRQYAYLESKLKEEESLQSQLQFQSDSQRKQILETIRKDSEKLNDELNLVQRRQDAEKLNLLESLRNAEQNANELVDYILQYNKSAERTERLLKEVEKDQQEMEKLCSVKFEEIQSLRKKEVLKAMELMFEDDRRLDEMVTNYVNEQLATAQRANNQQNDVDGHVRDFLKQQESRQNVLIENILSEEKLQRDAFEMLQCERDAAHNRITQQIRMIQNELGSLTSVEMEQRSMRLNTEQNVLNERRAALTQLLSTLLEQKSNREDELKKMMLEMEEQRDSSIVDYWLIQYQRLMDSKPTSLVKKARALCPKVVQVLEECGASRYISVFAKNKTTFKELLYMNDSDLRDLAITESDVRLSIIQRCSELRELQGDSEETGKGIEKLKKPVETTTPSEMGATAKPLVPSAPPPSEVTARLNPECVVCMDSQSNIVFLNCGHVCTCQKCSAKVSQCPLCRQSIVQRVMLSMSTFV